MTRQENITHEDDKVMQTKVRDLTNITQKSQEHLSFINLINTLTDGETLLR